jgi:hypothetical protein
VECGIKSDELSKPHGANSFIHNFKFPSIVKDELAVLQQRAVTQKTAETRITYDTLLNET